MAKRQFTPKGAIQVLSSDDPKAYYETYVKTGQTLVVTLPMTVKNELTKTGGQYENTAYQIEIPSWLVLDLCGVTLGTKLVTVLVS